MSRKPPVPPPDDDEEGSGALSPDDQFTIDAMIEGQEHPELYGDATYMPATDEHEQLDEARIPTVCLKCKCYPCICPDDE